MADAKKNSRLTVRIILITAIVVLGLNIVQTVVVNFISKATVTRTYEEECRFITETYSDLLSSKIREYFNLLEVYTNADVVATGDPVQIVSWLQSHANIRSSNFDYVAFVDLEGNFNSDIMTNTTVTERSYYIDIVKNGMDMTMDNPVASKVSGKSVIHICKAAKVNGRTIGFFTGIVSLESISEIVKKAKVGSTGSIKLLSGTGGMIATSSENEDGAKGDAARGSQNPETQKRVAQALSSGKLDSMWVKGHGALGSRGLLTFKGVPNTPQWFILTTLEEKEINLSSNTVTRFLIIGTVVFTIVLVVLISTLLIAALKPLGVVQSTINNIAEGNADLTKRIELRHLKNDEIGKVVGGFNKFAAKLQEIVKNIKVSKEELIRTGENLNVSTENTESSISQIIANIRTMGEEIEAQTSSVDQTAGAVNQIASNIDSLNHMISNQTSSVEQASSAIEEMIGNINSVNASVTKMSDAFEDLEKKAVAGIQKQEDVDHLIKTVEQESQTLQEANAVISSIAEQTNLLAMNAAIEAAHAGEAGKGFSVVADEIRKLSETSSQQSKTIGDQLKKISETITSIVQASSAAGASFSNVTSGINNTTSLVKEIKNAMVEQSAGSRQISVALNNMNDSTAEVRTASLEMSEGNKSILQEIKLLQNATLSIKNGMSQMSTGAARINETGSVLSDLTRQMENSINKIGIQIDEFHV